jgi:hypothetical protein
MLPPPSDVNASLPPVSNEDFFDTSKTEDAALLETGLWDDLDDDDVNEEEEDD